MSWMIENWMKNHLICDNNHNILIYNTKLMEWRIMLGLHLVSVTLYMQFATGIEQDE